jgi:cell division protease FtsH
VTGRRILLAALLLVLVALLVGQLLGGRARSEITYSRFLDLVGADRVVEVQIGEETITGVYQDGERISFTTTRPPGLDEQQLLEDLRAHEVVFTGSRPSGVGSFLRSLLVWVLPFLLIIGVWLFFLRRVQAGGGAGAVSLGRSQHKVYDRKDLRTSFADVAGLDEAVEEVGEVVDFLKDPRKYRRLGGRIPKGVLLVGAPGTGKTLLARAVAGEADVPFFYLSGSNFVQSSRCSWASAPPASATSSSRGRRMPRASCSSTSSTRSAARAQGASPAPADTKSASRPSISSSRRWTASILRRGSSSWPPRIAPRSSIRRS